MTKSSRGTLPPSPIRITKSIAPATTLYDDNKVFGGSDLEFVEGSVYPSLHVASLGWSPGGVRGLEVYNSRRHGGVQLQPPSSPHPHPLSSTAHPRLPDLLPSNGTFDPLRAWRQPDSAAALENPHRFQCPVFRYEALRGLPHSCNGNGSNRLSDLRRHLLRSTATRAAHLNFLKRCTTCQEDVLDEEIYNAFHGIWCHNPQPSKRRAAQNEHYRKLCHLVIQQVNASDHIISRKTQAPISAAEVNRNREPYTQISGPPRWQNTLFTNSEILDPALDPNWPPEPVVATYQNLDIENKGDKSLSIPSTLFNAPSHDPKLYYQAESVFELLNQDEVAVSANSPAKTTESSAAMLYNESSDAHHQCAPDFLFPPVDMESNNNGLGFGDHDSASSSETLIDASILDEKSSFSPSTSFTTDVSSQPDALRCERCSAQFTGAYRKGNLQRHRRLKHAGSHEKQYPCGNAKCGKVFARQDARLKHRRCCHSRVMTTMSENGAE